jgi:hypothetical protein
MGLLDDLKKQAELAKSQQVSAKSLQEDSLKAVDGKAKQTFQYLHDLLKQLAVLKPVNPLNFSIPGVVDLKNLTYMDSFIDNRKKSVHDIEVIDSISFYIKWGSASKISIEKDMPATAQKIRDGLVQNGVKFAEEEMRSPRGTIAGWKFVVDQAINTDVKVVADHENLRLTIGGRNLLRLGSDQLVVPILDINEAWLEEFAKSLLGHPSTLQKYVVQTPLR